ncbi:MAG TPA: hypothetical protein VEQ63_04120, partial [Bryobacteraceae bacterium]|nr:hypothetical protein [Bryobacteraceae bacterium]
MQDLLAYGVVLPHKLPRFFVEGERLYYVSNRAKLICLDIKGFTDNNENDGPFTGETLQGPKDADM